MNIENEITIKTSVFGNAVEIDANYPLSAMANAAFDEPFKKKLIEAYNENMNSSANNCIIEIQVVVGGSQVVRGLYELYRVVHANGGRLICSNYPTDYVWSMAALGLPSLDGFTLCDSKESARALLSPGTSKP